MRRLSWPNRIGVGMIVFMLIVSLILLLRTVMSPDNATRSSDDSPSGTERSQPLIAQEDPAEIVAEKRRVMRTLEKFIAAYYSRTPEMYAGGELASSQRLTRQVRPLVTSTFMSKVGMPNLSDDSLSKMVVAGRAFVARPDQNSISGHIEKGSVSTHLFLTIHVRDSVTNRIVRTLGREISLERLVKGWIISDVKKAPTQS